MEGCSGLGFAHRLRIDASNGVVTIVRSVSIGLEVRRWTPVLLCKLIDVEEQSIEPAVRFMAKAGVGAETLDERDEIGHEVVNLRDLGVCTDDIAAAAAIVGRAHHGRSSCLSPVVSFASDVLIARVDC